MKYLVYFKPSGALSELISSQKGIVKPYGGFHSTLSFFPMTSNKEGEIIENLSQIQFDPFEIETQKIELFDSSSQALTLTLPEELQLLHNSVVDSVSKYAQDSFNRISKLFYRDNYKPHYTISKSSINTNEGLEKLFGQKDVISEFYLAKKVRLGRTKSRWKVIGTFCSG